MKSGGRVERGTGEEVGSVDRPSVSLSFFTPISVHPAPAARCFLLLIFVSSFFVAFFNLFPFLLFLFNSLLFLLFVFPFFSFSFFFTSCCFFSTCSFNSFFSSFPLSYSHLPALFCIDCPLSLETSCSLLYFSRQALLLNSTVADFSWSLSSLS